MSTASETDQARRFRLRVLVSVAVLGFGAIAWTIAWILLAMHLRADFERWTESRRALGERLVHGDHALDGYPFAIRLTFPDVEWRRVDGRRTLSARTDRLAVSGALWAPLRLALRADSGLTLAWQAPLLDVTLTVAGASGAIDFGAVPVDRVSLELSDVLGLESQGRVFARAGRVSLEADPSPNPSPASLGSIPQSLTASLAVQALEPADGLPIRLPFEGPAEVFLKATVRGPLPAGIDPGELALWRDAGGVVDIDHLRIDWRPLELSADGTVTLDGLMRPEGAATARVRGLPATIERAVEQGVLAPGLAAVLKLAAAAFSRNADDGGGPAMHAPLTLQDGRLSVGPVVVARIPPLVR